MGKDPVSEVAARALRFRGRSSDPRHLAVALGFRLLPRETFSPPPRTVAYAWHPDPRVVAARVALGLSELLLREAEVRRAPGDAAQLARLLNPAMAQLFDDIRKAV